MCHQRQHLLHLEHRTSFTAAVVLETSRGKRRLYRRPVSFESCRKRHGDCLDKGHRRRKRPLQHVWGSPILLDSTLNLVVFLKPSDNVSTELQVIIFPFGFISWRGSAGPKLPGGQQIDIFLYYSVRMKRKVSKLISIVVKCPVCKMMMVGCRCCHDASTRCCRRSKLVEGFDLMMMMNHHLRLIHSFIHSIANPRVSFRTGTISVPSFEVTTHVTATTNHQDDQNEL